MVIEERKIAVPVMNGNVLTPAQPSPSPTDLTSNAPQLKDFILLATQSRATAAPATSAFPQP